MQKPRKLIFSTLTTWLIIFAIGMVWESVIRILLFHDSRTAGNSLSYVGLNLAFSILLAIVLGSLHSLLLIVLGRGGKYREKLQVLATPTVGVAIAAFLVAPTLNWQIRNNLPLKSMITVAVCVTTYLTCIILVRLFARLLPRMSELRIKEIGSVVILIPLLVLALQLVRGSQSIREEAKGPIQHVVVISIDTLRFDYVGAYGATETQTPNMDRAAQEGALYRLAVSPVPQTGPAHATIFTGQTPLVHGIHVNGQRLPKEAWTFTQRLQSAGFRTAAFVSGYPLQAKNCGLDQGFEIYNDQLTFIDTFSETYFGQIAEHTGLFREGILKLSRDVTNPALEFLSNQSNTPFFLFIHYYDPHYPYDYAEKLKKHPQWIRSSPDELPEQKRHYAQTVQTVDEQIGRVIALLKQKGIYDRTLLLITADHGESLGEHNYYYDHYKRLYEQLIRVPMIIRCPPLLRAGAVVEKQVSLMDVPQTVLASVGLEPYKTLNGYNLIHLASGLPGEYNRVTVSHAFENHLDAIRTQTWKLIRYKKDAKVTYELYDLSSDPAERVNLYQTRMEQARALQKMLAELIDGRGPHSQPDLSPEQVERLRSLGYIQ